ncbi:N-methyl-L-tryptophan oxidase [Virgibacillus oceani]
MFLWLCERIVAGLEEQAQIKVFYNTGILNIDTRDSDFLQNVIASANKFSLPVEILSAKEVNERWQGFDLHDNLIGCFESTSGVLLSEEAIMAYRELTLKNDAILYSDTKVEKIDVKDSIVEVSFNDKKISADNMLITAGKGTNKILSLLSLELPLTPIRKTFSWFNSNENIYNSTVFPAWSYDDGNQTYYGFPSIDNAGIKIGRHDGDIPVDAANPLEAFGSYPIYKHDVLNFTQKHFSHLGIHKLGRVCTYTNSPDGDIIIDRLPSNNNIFVACGFSGHRFEFGSVIGEILSQLMLDGFSALDISAFSLSRFK